MSQFDDPQPPAPPPAQPAAPQQDAFDAEMTPTGPAPMSAMAVTGFVSSLIVCCPVLSPLLGLIFSLVGLSQTRGGVRRGRGLAIAGLIIALVMGPVHLLGGKWMFSFMSAGNRLQTALTALQNSDGSEKTAALFALAGDSFRSQVSQQQLEDWLTGECSERGGLQKIELNPNQPIEFLPNNRMRYNWLLEFPSGTAVLATDLEVDFFGADLILVDMAIDGESVRQSTGNEGDTDEDG